MTLRDTPERQRSLFEALDLPHKLHPLQDAYWASRRKWEALRDAYEHVLTDMLARDDALLPRGTRESHGAGVGAPPPDRSAS